MANLTSSHTKSSTKILRCTCDRGDAAQYQDKKYGIGMRVHNPSKDGYKCTICGNRKSK